MKEKQKKEQSIFFLNSDKLTFILDLSFKTKMRFGVVDLDTLCS